MNDMNLETLVGLGHNRPPEDTIHDRLAEHYAELEQRRDALLAGCEHAPATVDDDETCGKVADFVKQVAACIKIAEKHRVAEKEPHLQRGREVDGWFKGIIEPLKKSKAEIERRLTEYQRKKAVEERRRREEEQRKAEEAARAAAEEARRQAESAASEAQLEDAIDAEERARQAGADALRKAREADAKAAELSRVRGDYGSVASLRTRWTGHLVDRATLDLERLREHLSEDAINQAIRAWVKTGGRELRGARIYKEENVQVR
jgi:hypothetical protein